MHLNNAKIVYILENVPNDLLVKNYISLRLGLDFCILLNQTSQRP